MHASKLHLKSRSREERLTKVLCPEVSKRIATERNCEQNLTSPFNLQAVNVLARSATPSGPALLSAGPVSPHPERVLPPGAGPGSVSRICRTRRAVGRDSAVSQGSMSQKGSKNVDAQFKKKTALSSSCEPSYKGATIETHA